MLEFEDVIINKSTIITNSMVITCNHCQKEFNDIENKSGSITDHMKECYPDVEIPSSYKRRSYIKLNGTLWHLQYFTLKEKINKETIKCPCCSWESVDIENKSGSFTKHIKDEHYPSIEDFLLIYKDYEKFFNTHKITKERVNYLNKDGNSVTCQICGEKMKFINNRHLKKHNITVNEYKIKFPNHSNISNNSFKIFKNNLQIANENQTPTWTSKGESEVFDYLIELGLSPEKSKNRKLLIGKEIDIIVQDSKIGIEYNGLYFHTEKMGKNSTYHLNKTISCSNIGYKLYHIFEDEWVLKNNIVKSKLRQIFNKQTTNSIGARKLVIKKIPSDIKSKFLEENHIQGNDKSNISYGGYYKDELIGVITFNGNRNMTKTIDKQFELTRFSIKSNYNSPGLCSKFLKHFISEYKPSSIISFADRRWTPDGNNNLYTKTGFKLVKILPPNYSYYNSKKDRYKRKHKFGFGKNNLKIKYPHLDFTKSEKELTEQLGYERIWDCGLFKYEMLIS